MLPTLVGRGLAFPGARAPKTYILLGPSGQTVESATPGLLGGNSRLGIYGRLDCTAADRALLQGYAKHRVFFADEDAAITNGFRPCGTCLRDRYKVWSAGGALGTAEYPWLVEPQK